MSKYSKTIASCAYLAASLCLLIFAIHLQTIFLYLGIACLLVAVVLSRISNRSSTSSFEDQIEQAIGNTNQSDDHSSNQNS